MSGAFYEAESDAPAAASSPERPRPPRYLVAGAAVVIGGCILLVAAALAAFAQTWDPCSTIAGCIVLVPFTFLGLQQYRAVFRRHRRAANQVFFALSLLGGLLVLGFFCNLGEALIDWSRNPRPLKWTRVLFPLLPFLAVGSGLLVAGWWNLLWYRQLRLAGWTRPVGPLRFSLRELLLVMAVVGSIAGLTAWFLRSNVPQMAEHVPVEKAPFGLPAGASDVSYYRGFRGTIAYEFTIDELGFRAWVAGGIGSPEANAEEVSLEEILAPVETTRYLELGGRPGGPARATITDGLTYDWWKADRGVHAAFDRKTGRAYYYAHFH